MRKVNIRKLRKDLAAELNELPFEVIRNGVVIATVVGDEIRKNYSYRHSYRFSG